MTGTQELFNLIKIIVDNYMSNRNPAGIVLGTYTGSAIELHSKMILPMDMISGNMKPRLVTGDKVKLLRDDGGLEYFILEIIGRPYQTGV